ncbi:SDR family NAD(P)-dependent oxidoreductase [Agrobacterium tumefaciens]|uniref:SDR family NAD(P)-dependent oxidoreductase n=1 Tax=Agrobacterium tumefaciens TaxID=358 RepID=UPI00243005D1|nr:SDR family oxidoreductase [Agrobacterium tumefaciens]
MHGSFVPRLGAYAASKAAVSTLSRTAALESVSHGVRINCLCPGPVDTPLSMRPGEDRAARDARVTATNPSRRVASTDEIAAAALWLASDSASYVVGQDIVIDGGASA